MFPIERWRVNLLVTAGHGVSTRTLPKQPEPACKMKGWACVPRKPDSQSRWWARFGSWAVVCQFLPYKFFFWYCLLLVCQSRNNTCPWAGVDSVTEYLKQKDERLCLLSCFTHPAIRDDPPDILKEALGTPRPSNTHTHTATRAPPGSQGDLGEDAHKGQVDAAGWCCASDCLAVALKVSSVLFSARNWWGFFFKNKTGLPMVQWLRLHLQCVGSIPWLGT